MAAPVIFSSAPKEIGASLLQNSGGFGEKSVKTVAAFAVIAGVFIFATRQLFPSVATQVSEGVSHLSGRFSSTVVPPYQRTKRKMMERAANAATKMVIGHSAMMTLGSLLLLPFQKNPEIMLARTARQFEKITLDQIDQLRCGPTHRILLRTVKWILDFRARFICNVIKTAAETPALPLLFACTYPSQLSFSTVKLTGLAVSTIALLGFSLKFFAWNDSIQFMVPPAIRTDFNQSIANRQFTYQAPEEKNDRDTFKQLPTELCLLIASYLSEKELSSLACLSRNWRLVSFSPDIRLPLLRQKFGDPLVNAIGPYLLTAPWHSIDTRLAERGRIIAPEDRNFAMREFTLQPEYDERWEPAHRLFERYPSCNAVRAPVQGQTVTCGLLVRFEQNRSWKLIETNSLHMPCVTAKQGIVKSTPYLYFIDGTDFKNSRIFLAKDAAERYVIGFLYDVYVNDGSGRILQGVSVLHELHRGSKEFVWIEKLPLDVLAPNGQFTIEKHPNPAEGIILKQLMFILKDNPSSSKVYLEWLQRLIKGEECGFLFYGGEFKQPLHLKI